MYGYCGKILRINLSDRSVKTYVPEERDFREFIGGAGLAAKLHYVMRTFEVDPLSSDNVLTVMTGPLTGTKAPSTSRLEFCARVHLLRYGERIERRRKDGNIPQVCRMGWHHY